ncbi:class I SAM-dependent methyltransferase [Pseudonocardia sp. HH130630-07]|uniref:class I SAM-dependent methyltransferase n=1 Tax=Pseudonocardia sp. HH130630-07 TaxID=1690815 RepID=UPI001E4AD80F|nr:class I SAM-dependent methyltransferase [Pseudonocardia sp. HH130630-07]
MRSHLDACRGCWDRWNRYRWDAALAHPLLDQLADFLGEDYRPYIDSSRALADDWDLADPQTPAEVAAFFQTSTNYLYNLAIWEASGNRPAYLNATLPVLQALPVRTVLDLGSGIGSDAIALQAAGFRVTTCDFDSPSTRFCAYRADMTLPRICPTVVSSEHAADVLWCIDTLDHLPDPDHTLNALLPLALAVVTEDLDENRAHGRQRFHHRHPPSQIRAMFERSDLRPHRAGPATVWMRPTTWAALPGRTARPARHGKPDPGSTNTLTFPVCVPEREPVLRPLERWTEQWRRGLGQRRDRHLGPPRPQLS